MRRTERMNGIWYKVLKRDNTNFMWEKIGECRVESEHKAIRKSGIKGRYKLSDSQNATLCVEQWFDGEFHWGVYYEMR